MITVTAVQSVKAGQHSRLEALMQDLTEKVRQEPGCVTFDYVRSRDNPNSYLVIEQYVDQSALTFHLGTTYLQSFIPEMMECLEQAPAVVVHDDVFAPPGPPAPPSFFHVGIIVPDLTAAIARYSEVLGIKFTEPATFHIPRLEDPEPHEGSLTAAFSMTEPPYYELIQGEGNGITSLANAGKILYYGVWEEDMARRVELLKQQNVGIEALFRMDADSPPYALITKPDLLGARIEYVSIEDRAPILAWVKTGKFPGGIGA